jgi:hypothetical protein
MLGAMCMMDFEFRSSAFMRLASRNCSGENPPDERDPARLRRFEAGLVRKDVVERSQMAGGARAPERTAIAPGCRQIPMES